MVTMHTDKDNSGSSRDGGEGSNRNGSNGKGWPDGPDGTRGDGSGILRHRFSLNDASRSFAADYSQADRERAYMRAARQDDRYASSGGPDYGEHYRPANESIAPRTGGYFSQNMDIDAEGVTLHGSLADRFFIGVFLLGVITGAAMAWSIFVATR